MLAENIYSLKQTYRNFSLLPDKLLGLAAIRFLTKKEIFISEQKLSYLGALAITLIVVLRLYPEFSEFIENKIAESIINT